MHRFLNLAGIAAALALGLIALLWFSNRGDNERIIVPQWYRGFVGIFYDQPAGSALKMEGGWLILDFPAASAVFTSARPNTGWHRMEFFERDGGRLVPMRANLVGSIPPDIPASERIYTGGAAHISSGISAAVVYHIGDAADRAQLDWQSSGKWIQAAVRAKQ